MIFIYNWEANMKLFTLHALRQKLGIAFDRTGEFCFVSFSNTSFTIEIIICPLFIEFE